MLNSKASSQSDGLRHHRVHVIKRQSTRTIRKHQIQFHFLFTYNYVSIYILYNFKFLMPYGYEWYILKNTATHSSTAMQNHMVLAFSTSTKKVCLFKKKKNDSHVCVCILLFSVTYFVLGLFFGFAIINSKSSATYLFIAIFSNKSLSIEPSFIFSISMILFAFCCHCVRSYCLVSA